ncbi:hypothetical protein [Luteimonas sp. e5]
MNTHTHRPPQGPARRPASPRRRWLRDGLFTVTGMALVLSLSASAEWRVQDREARSTLKEIRDSNTIGGNSGTNEITKDPGEMEMKGHGGQAIANLDKTKITQARFENTERCGSRPGRKAEDVHRQQWTICTEIVTTELAQYQYSLEMYARAKKRHEDLAKLEEERNNLKGYQDYGKLQTNTNKILALQAQLQIDHLQDKTYMDAYHARLQYLRAAQTTLADRALNGTREFSLLGAAVDLTAGKAMKEALRASHTDRARNR